LLAAALGCAAGYGQPGGGRAERAAQVHKGKKTMGDRLDSTKGASGGCVRL
jgi:hypothetical protein